ncbi:type III secretion system protein [Salmonella enterica]
MTIINNMDALSRNQQQHELAADEPGFNDIVLNYVKNNRPEGSLQELLQQMKSLATDTAPTLQQLNTALLYTDATLRQDPDYQSYTSSTLDKHTTQMFGVNMLTNQMVNKLMISSDDDKDLI